MKKETGSFKCWLPEQRGALIPKPTLESQYRQWFYREIVGRGELRNSVIGSFTCKLLCGFSVTFHVCQCLVFFFLSVAFIADIWGQDDAGMANHWQLLHSHGEGWQKVELEPPLPIMCLYIKLLIF